MLRNYLRKVVFFTNFQGFVPIPAKDSDFCGPVSMNAYSITVKSATSISRANTPACAPKPRRSRTASSVSPKRRDHTDQRQFTTPRGAGLILGGSLNLTVAEVIFQRETDQSVFSRTPSTPARNIIWLGQTRHKTEKIPFSRCKNAQIRLSKVLTKYSFASLHITSRLKVNVIWSNWWIVLCQYLNTMKTVIK